MIEVNAGCLTEDQFRAYEVGVRLMTDLDLKERLDFCAHLEKTERQLLWNELFRRSLEKVFDEDDLT